MIVVNFKTYREASGNNAITLARICRAVQEKTKVRIVAVPQLADLRNCVETGVDCWVQHVDAVTQGKFTGWVSPEDVEEMGAKGTLLNHSEHRLAPEVLKKTMEQIGTLAFEGCVCADGQEPARKAIELLPNFLAYEPPEFIGSTDKSVSTEKPEIISEMVKLAGQIPVLVGAGVHTQEDIRVAIKLGARGVLLATGVVLATDPEKALMDLAKGFV